MSRARRLRIVIAGGPRTGKTTLADTLGLPVRHTDDLIDRGWVAAGAAAAAWLDRPGPWVIEGVAAPRALRRWMKRHPRGKPCDVIAFLARPRIPRTARQEAMARGCATTFAGIRAALAARGVVIVRANQLRAIAARGRPPTRTTGTRTRRSAR